MRTKAQLRVVYERERARFQAGQLYANEYALHLDTMLAEFFGLDPASYPAEED